MLQKEFEELIGRKVTESEYVEANAVYMTAGDIDKDEFCKEWMQFGQSKLVQGLFETAYRMNQAHQEDTLIINETREMLSDAADAMLEIADGLLGGGTAEREPSEVEVLSEGLLTKAFHALTQKAWWLVGQKEVTKRRVAAGYRLDGKDRETIINNLTK